MFFFYFKRLPDDGKQKQIKEKIPLVARQALLIKYY